jgi:hypothetical protein
MEPRAYEGPHNKPLEWTSRLKLSAAPPQPSCLPLRGSVKHNPMHAYPLFHSWQGHIAKD